MQHMAQHPEGEAACDRLIALFEYARTVEEKRHPRADDTLREPLIRYMLALLRMHVRPALTPGWLRHDPVHVTLFGSTNSGKSTVVNVCLGRVAAGMHVTARFSQHPEAYRPAALGERWLSDYPSRFPGYACYRDEHPPRQSDRDLETQGYHPALAILDPAQGPGKAITLPASTQAVFWDAPDFSTDAAQAYLGTVLDVAAIADIVVLTVTDESYADDRGCALLRLLSAAGACVHIVVNKLAPGTELMADIIAQITAHWRGAPSGLSAEQWHALPRVSGSTPTERLAHLLLTSQATALREAIGQTAEQLPDLKRRVLLNTVDFLGRRLEDVLQVLASEVEVAAAWASTVTRLVNSDCLERYQQDYLHGQDYSDFNQALARVMTLLEVPGVGPVVKQVSDAVRLPFRALIGWLKKRWHYPNGTAAQRLPEAEILLGLVTHCLAVMKAEAQMLAETDTHPAWNELARGLDSRGWYTQVVKDFEAAYATYRQQIDAEVQQRAAAIYAMIAQRPGLLNVLRGTNLVMDAATLVFVVKSGGLNWSDAIVGPMLASLRRVLVEAGLEQYISKQADLLRRRQFAALQTLVTTHLIAPLCRLFQGPVRRDEIEAARRDFAQVKATVLRLTKEESPWLEGR